VKSREKNKRKPTKRASGKTHTRASAETQAPAPLSTQQQPGQAIISPQKARTISTGIIPGQFAGSRPALYRSAQPTQTPPNPYFPDLWSRPSEQNSATSTQSVESKSTNSAPSNTREVFFRPILDKKGFSIHDWAKQASVDFHTANNYLKGKTKPYPATIKKLADALGIEVAKLPA
jgi:hypothetical protein